VQYVNNYFSVYIIFSFTHLWLLYSIITLNTVCAMDLLNFFRLFKEKKINLTDLHYLFFGGFAILNYIKTQTLLQQ